MTLVWGLIYGIQLFLPYFYFVFFALMIIHRWTRDEERCLKKYRNNWEKYNVLSPYVLFSKLFEF